MEDVDVLCPDSLRLDNHPDMWACHFENGLLSYFTSEDDACMFQRMWRIVHNLNPITGE